MTVTRARLECHIPTKGNAAVQQGAKKDREKWYEQILQAYAYMCIYTYTHIHIDTSGGTSRSCRQRGAGKGR